ncbi:MAG: glycosyl hydrolase 115 family protein, partial [Lachnospiraceae bacterium]|nr:glycosyl hydrolase 115 family protein [Lachnospiraceae bacterium]
MKTIILHDSKTNVSFIADKAADSGLVKVLGKVADDYNQITGEKEKSKKSATLNEKAPSVFAGIVGESEILDKLEKEGKIDLKNVRGKWEVYKMTVVGNALIVAGSDKLGAIYGLFSISELMGVSPLCWIADSVIPKKKVLKINVDEKASKEPSVKFRGFFINDEWPCFGNWTFEHFGGFTAEMYDHVFELLLRLKGNYLWPAMWSSSFAWDGPGLKNYELATEYGIYIGNSHHEPCLRAGEEYRHVRGKDSIYGDAWNYHANTKGITRFWKDSMDERGMFTSVVTVGMRGEADTTILGANATLKDNIDLLKDVILCQKKIIKETEKKYNKTFPMVLALYKEVEPFYYGDKDTEGLCDWDELNDVTLMLCEDNHGYLRTVPDEKMRNHPAGFGMYYHVDYHGDPISYEWINSSPLPLMWEQMSQAYDYGVRNIWILNVGDLKHNEFPLSYFLNLAYDFDKWGTKA